jgi:hypothetical protein
MPVALYDIYGTGLYIENPVDDPNFHSQARISLNVLRSREIGVTLLKDICAACADGKKSVVIEKSGTANAVPTTDTSDGFRLQLKQPGMGQILTADAYALVARGKGGASGIARWNPANVIPGTTIERPSYVSLAHELIHCLHYVQGDCYREPKLTFDLTVDSGLAEEEARTTGLGPYKDIAVHKMSENAFRDAFGQPRRTEYCPGNTLDHVKATA